MTDNRTPAAVHDRLRAAVDVWTAVGGRLRWATVVVLLMAATAEPMAAEPAGGGSGVSHLAESISVGDAAGGASIRAGPLVPPPRTPDAPAPEAPAQGVSPAPSANPTTPIAPIAPIAPSIPGSGSDPGLPAPPSGAGVPAPGAGYAWPLHPAPIVLSPFRAPEHSYGPGHRGADLAGAVGQAVVAARTGVVIFAGPVAGRGVVSVEHDDGLRTTYEPVRPAVRAGSPVAAGAVLGALEAGHRGCLPACLHWGVRRDRLEYLDPLVLLQPTRVRLLPVPPR